MVTTGNLGFPRIGENRELKFALEKYWKDTISSSELLRTATYLQKSNIKFQKQHGIDHIPVGDFSLYDHVLDHAVMLDAIPSRFKILENADALDQYFYMARGFQKKDGSNLRAMEMTKWFNTNYHYIVPEITEETIFNLNPADLLAQIEIAHENNVNPRPVILGPVSFLGLSKDPTGKITPISKINQLLPQYRALFNILDKKKIDWIQLDEPLLSTDLEEVLVAAYLSLFNFFSEKKYRPNIMLTSYFGDLSLNAALIDHSSFEGLHIDGISSENIEELIQKTPEGTNISIGYIDGKNIWRSDLQEIYEKYQVSLKSLGARDLIVSPSCSMLHLPLDTSVEDELDEEIRSWLCFAKQKIGELETLKITLNGGQQANDILIQSAQLVQSRKKSKKIFAKNPIIGIEDLEDRFFQRKSPFAERNILQKKTLQLPILPTTTIGSFPQTKLIRKKRAEFNKKAICADEYEQFIRGEIQRTITIQEEIGIDVLVHGEFERNDMVQYFGEQLRGFAFTKKGWVQSFGSRYVRPPIIYGDVERTHPLTTKWSTFAQTLTKKPVKGMLTGPVTILKWSFVRDDLPLKDTCCQIALAILEETQDLEKSGIPIIQIDEPALREGLPLQKKYWPEYLDWTVKCFKIASSGVQDQTQIHTHMCYAEFKDIINAIIEMDADVISIEASRSKMDLLNSFREVSYPNEIGPGIYDIHSQSIPETEEIETLLKHALCVIPAEKLWVNPDCGLKTRTWEEVIPSLTNMVRAAKLIRNQINNRNKINE